MSGHATLPNQLEGPAAYLAIRLVSVAEVMQLLPRSAEHGVDTESLMAALTAFARQGVARHAAALGERLTASQLADVLPEVFAAVEDSPLPRYEWGPLAEILGEGLLEKLLGVSGSSIHRYRNGERPTPDHIAARLHAVTLIVADLAGSYNDFGIRRWFGRSRSALSGHSPAEILTGDWGPGDAPTQQVRALAASLLAPLAA